MGFEHREKFQFPILRDFSNLFSLSTKINFLGENENDLGISPENRELDQKCLKHSDIGVYRDLV